MFLSSVPLYAKKPPSGNRSQLGAREPMPSDRPMNSQSASPARIKTSTYAPQGRASARPMTIARITKALRIRTISALGFQPPARNLFWVVTSVGLGRELVLGPASKAADARSVVGQRRFEVFLTEIRPQRFGYEHLRVGRLPQQEVAHASFAGGADDEVGVGQVGDVQPRRDRRLVDLFGSETVGNELLDGIQDLGAAAVVEADVEHAVGVAAGAIGR